MFVFICRGDQKRYSRVDLAVSPGPAAEVVVEDSYIKRYMYCVSIALPSGLASCLAGILTLAHAVGAAIIKLGRSMDIS